MKTKLENLIDSIDPSKNLDKVSRRVDAAVNSFNIKTGMITDWYEFRSVLSKFVRHIENEVLQIPGFKPEVDDYDWGHAVRILMKKYGNEGDKAAFEMVRTGTQGGLYKILKIIAEGMTSKYSGNEISGRVSAYWENLTVAEMLEAPNEYLEKYGHLFPSELTEGSAARIRVNFRKVLEEHPKMIRRLKRKVR